MSMYSGTAKAVNFLIGSVPMLVLDKNTGSGSTGFLDIAPNSSFVVPFNIPWRFTWPSEAGVVNTNTMVDSNGKTWTLSYYHDTAAHIQLTIDDVGTVTSVTATTISWIAGCKGFIIFFLIPNGFDNHDQIFIAFFVTSAGVKGTFPARYAGNFINGVTECTNFSTQYGAPEPVGTTIESFNAAHPDNCVYTEATSAGFRVACSSWPYDYASALNQFSFSVPYSSPLFAYIAEGASPQPIVPDPYAPIPESATGGGGGTFDFTTTDDITLPVLPALSPVSSGFLSLWSPTEQQLEMLVHYLWNANPLDLAFWRKIFADPMDMILGLSIVPLDLSTHINPGESTPIIDGAGSLIAGLVDTKVTMNHIGTQWVELDCGSITIDETWGAYLDYDPFTKLEIYLPYCGTHPLKVDDFMPGTITVKYRIDLLSGACVANIISTKANTHGDELNSIIYQFMGTCTAQVPVTSLQFADMIRSVISVAAAGLTMYAIAGAGGAAIGTGGAQKAMPSVSSSLIPSSTALAPIADSGDINLNYMVREGIRNNSLLSGGGSSPTSALKNIGQIHAAASAGENVMGMKPSVSRSGAIGSTGGLLGVQKPYLILTRPRQARPNHQNYYTGYPSFMTEDLDDLRGYTIIQAIHLEGIPCTADELGEIEELLTGGVFF